MMRAIRAMPCTPLPSLQNHHPACYVPVPSHTCTAPGNSTGWKLSSFFQNDGTFSTHSLHSSHVGNQKSRFFMAASSVPAVATAPPQNSGNVQKKNVIDILRERGLVDGITNEELRAATSEPDTAPVRVYVGFDPTAESLHLGNLLGIIALSWFQRCGHTPVALLGGATGRVGDPSGKSAERPMMDEETIERHVAGIQTILVNILRVEEKPTSGRPGMEKSGNGAGGGEEGQGRQKPIFVNNYSWWKEVSLLGFLRDVGKFARVGTMMAKESVKRRLTSEEGMSYTEFTYQLLQGYDFVHLNREMGVTVQMGGSDQWGNITAGTDLVRRLGGLGVDGEGAGPTAYGLTWPLLLKSDGTKFGKSEGGAIWLAPTMLSPYKFYQYLFSTPDADVINFMKRLTFMEMEDVARYESSMAQPGYVPNTAQKRLAQEVTLFVHGVAGLEDALQATAALAPGAATKLDINALEAIAEDIPSTRLASEKVDGVAIVDLAVSAGLFPSKAAARRLVQQGGLYLNNEKVLDVAMVIGPDNIVGGKMLLLAAGKKNKMLVRIEGAL